MLNTVITMSGDEREADPFRRKPRVQRSPPERSLSLPGDFVRDGEAAERTTVAEIHGTPEMFGENIPKKRKAMSPTQAVKNVDLSGDVDDDDRNSEAKSLVDNMRGQLTDLSKYVTGLLKNKRLTILQHGEFSTRITELKALARDFAVKIAFLEGRLSERLHVEKILKSTPETLEQRKTATYAEMASYPKLPGIKAKAQPSNVVFVRSKDDKMNIETIKNVIKETVKPSQLGINVKRVTKTARGLMIETEGHDQLDRIEKCSALKNKGLIVEKPRKKLPRIMIYDVESADQEDTIVQDIYKQNFENSDLDLDAFKNEFRCVHKYRHKDLKDERSNWVVECTARVRNIVRTRERIYIGWQSCRLKDYNPLVRCFKCQSFGHTSRVCRGKETCSHCAGEHDIAHCPKKAEQPQCSNCLRAKKDPHHPVNSAKCPELQRATRIAFERIDYGP